MINGGHIDVAGFAARVADPRFPKGGTRTCGKTSGIKKHCPTPSFFCVVRKDIRTCRDGFLAELEAFLAVALHGVSARHAAAAVAPERAAVALPARLRACGATMITTMATRAISGHRRARRLSPSGAPAVGGSAPSPSPPRGWHAFGHVCPPATPRVHTRERGGGGSGARARPATHVGAGTARWPRTRRPRALAASPLCRPRTARPQTPQRP